MHSAHAFLDPLAAFFGRLLHRREPRDAGESRILQERLRIVARSQAAERAAQLLCAPTALVQLSHDEALAVVAYMRPHRIAEGTRFIREGDPDNTGFLLLVLDGEVAVESAIANRDAPITTAVMGPGSILGEISLIDGSPRSASCTALSQLRGALLTREAFTELLDADPRTAAKLVIAIAHRIAQRMRESQDKLKLYTQLTQAMNEEINDLMPL